MIWMVWLVPAHSRLVVSANGLDVVNWVCRYRIPWAAVAWVEATHQSHFAPHIWHTGAARHGAWTIVGVRNGNPKQNEIAAKVQQWRKRAADDKGKVVIRTMDLCPLPFVALYAAALAGAWVMT
jgi:hypothetical protein